MSARGSSAKPSLLSINNDNPAMHIHSICFNVSKISSGIGCFKARRVFRGVQRVTLRFSMYEIPFNLLTTRTSKGIS